jgi:hypothetical protein
VKVRIKNTPHQREIDGIKLDRFVPGDAYEVSASVGSWLIAEGYAWPEMRNEQEPGEKKRFFIGSERRAQHLLRAPRPVQRKPFSTRA